MARITANQLDPLDRVRFPVSPVDPHRQLLEPGGARADWALRTGLDALADARSGHAAGTPTVDPLAKAAHTFTTRLAKATDLNYDTVLNTLSNPDLPAEQTLRSAAQMLYNNPNARSGGIGSAGESTAGDISKIESAMRGSMGMELLSTNLTLREVMTDPGGATEIPTGAAIGEAAIDAGLSTHKDIVSHRLVTNTLDASPAANIARPSATPTTRTPGAVAQARPGTQRAMRD